MAQVVGRKHLPSKHEAMSTTKKFFKTLGDGLCRACSCVIKLSIYKLSSFLSHTKANLIIRKYNIVHIRNYIKNHSRSVQDHRNSYLVFPVNFP
jgi:hypothetical protein